MSLSIQRNLSLSEATMASQALDLLTRIGIGQIDQIAEQVRMDNVQAIKDGKLGHSTLECCQIVDRLVDAAERTLDYPQGASYGIGHKYVSETAHHAWELKKIIDQALANHRDPNPRFRGVNYDGLSIKYTKDPTPEVTIVGDGDAASVQIKMTPNQLAAMNKALGLQVRLMSGDFSVLTKHLRDGFLIPFDKKDYFGNPVHESRPKATDKQIYEFESWMKGVETTLGFEEPIDLLGHEVPNHFKATLSAQAQVKQQGHAEPGTPRP